MAATGRGEGRRREPGAGAEAPARLECRRRLLEQLSGARQGSPQVRTVKLRSPLAAALLRASHTPRPLEGMAHSLLPLSWSQFLEREVKGGSPRTQGRSRFPQARAGKQQEFGWGEGSRAHLSNQLSCPPRPTLHTTNLCFSLEPSGPPVLYTPTCIAPEPDGQPLPPSLFLSLLPPSSSSPQLLLGPDSQALVPLGSLRPSQLWPWWDWRV